MAATASPERLIAAQEDYSFKAFSEHPFYKEVNIVLVEEAQLERGWTVVDVACGSGLVTAMILDKIRGARDAMVIGLDMSTTALKDARERLAGAKEAVVEFVQAQAEEMSQKIKKAADAVVFCNGIHYIEDKHRLLKEVARTLRPGGIFAFNTSFFDGALPPETQRFYRRWMMKAVRKLKRDYNLKPTRKKVESRHHLSAEDYRELLESEGFKVRSQEILLKPISKAGWADISRFSDFIVGALPGIEIKTASKVLVETLNETCEELKLHATPRNWLTVVAVRA